MASTAQLTRKQDLPPPGGYAPIDYTRIPAKKYFKGWTMIAGYLGLTFGSAYLYYLNYKKIQQNKIEMRSARLALFPLLLAERDREFLKQVRRNRDEEAKLMANVPGWEVGTYYGDPIYKTFPADRLLEPSFQEYYTHARDGAFKDRVDITLWS